MGISMKPVLAALLIICFLTGCSVEAAESTVSTALPTETTAPAETTVPTEPPHPAEEILSGMTLREKVGQLFIVRPDALRDPLSQEKDGQAVTAVTDDIFFTLEQYPVGGIAMFSENIVSPEQITGFNTALQHASNLPLFLAVDEEGGTVSRLANHNAFDLPNYKSVASVGTGENPEHALEMGSTIGAYLKEYGFNMNFAPVADVLTNPANTAIGRRAFSGSAEVVSGMAAAMAKGLNSQGIIAVFKHFPGHGDTKEDSHDGLAITYKTGQALSDCELLPFREADNGNCIMVGHIAVPEVTGDMTPASMSYTITTDLLKHVMGFDGLVITDSLSMGAITNSYTSAEAAVSALLAGCDILLLPPDLPEAFDAVVAAVENGILTQQWLDETVLRILEFKMLHGILKY